MALATGDPIEVIDAIVHGLSRETGSADALSAGKAGAVLEDFTREAGSELAGYVRKLRDKTENGTAAMVQRGDVAWRRPFGAGGRPVLSQT